MVTTRQILDWYNTMVPQLIFTQTEDQIINSMRLALNVTEDFDYLWWNNPDYAQYVSGDEWMESIDSSKYSPLTLKVLFTDAANRESPLRIPKFNLNRVRPQDNDITDSYNQIRSVMQTRKLVQLPIWMWFIKRYGSFRKLQILSPVSDSGWLVERDEPTWYDSISNASDISLQSISSWGNYLPSGLTDITGMDDDSIIRRHNIIIWELTKLMAYRPLWDLDPSVMGPRQQIPINIIPNRGKIAAMMLYQSILYCRLIAHQYAIENNIDANWSVYPKGEWVPIFAHQLSAPYGAVRQYLFTPGPAFQRMMINCPSAPIFLGAGSLISSVSAESVSQEQWESASEIGTDGNWVGTPLSIVQSLSIGLIPQWMANWRHMMVHARRHPASHLITAGVWNVPSPEFSGSYALSRNISRLACYGNKTPYVDLTPGPASFAGRTIKATMQYITNTLGATTPDPDIHEGSISETIPGSWKLRLKEELYPGDLYIADVLLFESGWQLEDLYDRSKLREYLWDASMSATRRAIYV